MSGGVRRAGRQGLRSQAGAGGTRQPLAPHSFARSTSRAREAAKRASVLRPRPAWARRRERGWEEEEEEEWGGIRGWPEAPRAPPPASTSAAAARPAAQPGRAATQGPLPPPQPLQPPPPDCCLHRQTSPRAGFSGLALALLYPPRQPLSKS